MPHEKPPAGCGLRLLVLDTDHAAMEIGRWPYGACLTFARPQADEKLRGTGLCTCDMLTLQMPWFTEEAQRHTEQRPVFVYVHASYEK
jgi:hypothetical protein